MEQQCKVTQLTWEEFKPLFLNTPLHMRLGEEDLKHLEESEGTKFVILEATTTDTTEYRFKTAINGIYKEFKKYGLSPTSSWKGLFLVGYPNSYPITMVDMSYISTFLENSFPHVELKWDIVANDTSACKIICCLKM